MSSNIYRAEDSKMCVKKAIADIECTICYEWINKGDSLMQCEDIDEVSCLECAASDVNDYIRELQYDVGFMERLEKDIIKEMETKQ